MIRHSVKEKLPEVTEEDAWTGWPCSSPVLAWSYRGKSAVCRMHKINEETRWFEGVYDVTDRIAYWTYIPEFEE